MRLPSSLLTSQLLDLVTQGEPHVRRPGDSPHLLGDDGDAEFGDGEVNPTKLKSKFHFRASAAALLSPFLPST